MRFVITLLILAGLIYAFLAGFGILHARPRGIPKKITVLDDFEDANNDMDWYTGGYAQIQQSTQNRTHGKHSAKVTFYLESQFMATPTPQATWEPQITMDEHSVTQLPVFDWSGYTSLKMDVFNPQSQPVTYFLRVSDSHTFSYQTSGVLVPNKVTNISLPMADLLQARLDLTSINSIQFWVDMTGATQPLSVYLDYLRLEYLPSEAKKI